MKTRLILPCLMALMLLVSAARVEAGGTPLDAVRVAAGVGNVVFATSPPGDYERLFLVQRTGGIRILNLLTNTIVPGSFLNLSSQISTTPGNERGLLGMAFHPDFDNNGYFYVYFNNNGGTSIVRRYTVSATNPNQADTSTAFPILIQSQPDWNHNGGMISFGPDGYLYIGFGDGGGGGDTYNTSQNINTRLAKMLRIDVDGPDAFPSGNDNFAIPADNPFVGVAGLDEIWSWGLRNPWRWSFDSLTGDMWIADVGQGVWEEINFQPANSTGGENYGWRCMEGNHCFGGALPTCSCNSATLTDPVWEYSHGGIRCSVTGGYVYRGMAIPDLDGTYFFADYCSSQIWSLRYNGVSVSDFEERTAELDPPGAITIGAISSFGQDAMGEIYICDLGGEVFKIVPSNIASLDCNDNFIIDTIEFSLGLAQDCNNNGLIDACEIDAGTATDCDGNGLIDSCEFTAGTAIDCDNNGVIDTCDIAAGTLDDCNLNDIPDTCELAAGALDCNNNGVIDSCDVVNGLIDCNTNDIPDECELADGTEFDCNTNGILDSCDVDFFLAFDCDNNGILDECEFDAGTAIDCNTNGVIDSCDIANGEPDMNMNGIPDVCDAAQFVRGDCNDDGGFDVADAVFLLGYLFDPTGGDPNCLDSCDVNDDGGLNIADAVTALDSLFGMGGPPGSPNPDCGADPTADMIECDMFSGCP